MGQSRLVGIDVRLRDFAQALQDRVIAHGNPNFTLCVTDGYRSHEHQEALFAQGRRPLSEVNQLRARVPGLYPISEAANKRPVTNSRGGQSPHQYRAAIDVALYNAKPDDPQKRGELIYGAGSEWFWDAVRALTAERRADLVWGADWDSDGETRDERFLDFPHVELRDWRLIRDGKAQIRKF
jgi:hypothetical protein